MMHRQHQPGVGSGDHHRAAKAGFGAQIKRGGEQFSDRAADVVVNHTGDGGGLRRVESTDLLPRSTRGLRVHRAEGGVSALHLDDGI